MINDCPIEGSFDGDQFTEHEKPYLLVRKVFLQPAIDISSLATYTSLDTCQMKLNYCPKKRKSSMDQISHVLSEE